MMRWIIAAGWLLATVPRVGAQPVVIGPDPQPERSAPPNIVLILMDDMGLDLLGIYGAAAAPCTPNIDRLAGEGLLFENAWSTPLCSPTRAQIMTGLHPRRSGMGAIANRTSWDQLSTRHATLPRILSSRYESAAVGKWHLASIDSDITHAYKIGFDYFSGSMGNLELGIANGNYDLWARVIGSGLWVERTHATEWTVEHALERAREMMSPWFLYVPFNAVHSPWYFPKPDQCADPACLQTYCAGTPDNNPTVQIRAMVESFDMQLGRLLEGLAEIDPATIIIFAGDNGTPPHAVIPPLTPQRAKRSVYQGGVCVPLIIKGPGVRRGRTDALVTLADLFPTLIELAGLSAPLSDGRSLVPLLTSDAYRPHATVYTERFQPNFDPFGEPFQPITYARAVRDKRYKLIREKGPALWREEMYDLWLDPLEQHNLLPPMNFADVLTYIQLSFEMARYAGP